MKNTYFKKFPLKKGKKLSKSDLEVVRLCEKMLKITGEIFSQQVGSNSPEGETGLYPAGIKKEELLRAGKKNSQILSPYTVIRRDSRGRLIALPFRDAYSKPLCRIATIAKEASLMSKDKRLAGYLKRLSKTCFDDSWEDLENYWLSIEGNNLDFQLAPIEPYMDKVLSLKHFFQGTLRVAGDIKRFNPEEYVETIKAMHTLSPYVGGKSLRSAVKVRVDDVLARAGYQAALPARGSNYPNDPAKVKKVGTKIIIYTTNIIEREQKGLLPTLKKVVSPKILSPYNDEQFFSALVSGVMMHEIAEALIKYPDSVSRLKAMYLPVKELHASLMGAKVASFHVLKGALSQDSYKLMLLTHFIGRIFSDWVGLKRFGGGLDHYVRGYTVAFNYFLDKGAVRIDGRYVWVNMPRLFSVVDSLSFKFNSLMASGKEKDAEKFFSKYEDYSFFQGFKKILK